MPRGTGGVCGYGACQSHYLCAMLGVCYAWSVLCLQCVMLAVEKLRGFTLYLSVDVLDLAA